MEKLRILIVTQGKLSNVLGAVKVHYELKREYEKKGHTVDTLDLSVLYPNGRSRYELYFGKLPTYRIWKYLKRNGHKYNVIDANIESVVYPKNSFGFKGVLFARSHGIRPLFDKAEAIPEYQKALRKERENYKLKTHIGNFIRSFEKKPGPEVFFASIKYADIVHCLNAEEYQYYIDLGIAKEKLLCVPNGLPDTVIESFNNLNKEAKNENSISFLASWTVRKGIKDLDHIINEIQKSILIKHLVLMGGYSDEKAVKKEFSNHNHGILKIVPHFEPDQIPQYLKNCKVGIFPSYVEGFPFAVLEQLACGLPVVAYKVCGPTDILKNIDESLLIPPGNAVEFAKKVTEILQLDKDEYLKLSEKCTEESRKYLLSDISNLFLNAFYAKLKTLPL